MALREGPQISWRGIRNAGEVSFESAGYDISARRGGERLSRITW